jgi:hypothetical protein
MLKGMKQIRRGAGMILIGLGLLMAIGVSRAKLPPNPVVTGLTIGISVILPIAVGIGLVASTGQRTQKSLDPAIAARRSQTIQAEMVKLAIAQGGALTVVEVVSTLGIDSQTATQELTALTYQQIAELEMTDSGLMVYRFPDVQSLPEKYHSKRIADV